VAPRPRPRAQLQGASCEPTLTAIDAASGETVWRARDRLRFCRPAAYDNNALFVVAGDSSPRLRTAEALLCLDPWTGLVRWRRELPAGARAVGAPSPAQQAVVVALHDPRGTGFAAFDRGDGALGWRIDPGFAPATSAWLVVDETLVVNGASGAVSAIDLSRGGCRWQHRFERGGDADVPRHLDPLLRSGALFVPQHKVHVLRPNDGDELGQVPSDLVPDLVRVDERCNVVVVEDSGHLAAFQAGARLTLVKG
jgi:outer membrane protein assembly factor BamB